MKGKRIISAVLALSLFTGVLSVPSVSGDSELPIIPIVVEDDISCLVFEKVGDTAYVVSGYTGDMENVVIPSKYDGCPVIGIKDSAFAGVTTIKTVTFREGATFIGDNAFFYSSVESVKLPESLNSIGSCAFESCNALKSISIPKNVDTIGKNSFNSPNLDTLTVDPDNNRYVSIDNVIYERDENSGEPVKLITAAKTVETVTVPDTVTDIGPDAFVGCEHLTKVIYGDNVRNIGINAFYNCRDLQVLYVPRKCDIDTEMLGQGIEDLTIYGYSATEIESYAQENDIKFVALGDNDYEINLIFSDTALGYMDLHIFMTLTDKDGNVVKTTDGGLSSEDFHFLEDGEYTLTARADYFGTKTQTVTMENWDFAEAPDLDLYTIGDANLDGRVNTEDITAIKKHLKKTAVLSGYALTCANADKDEDGTVSTSDITAIKAYMKGTRTLWQGADA